MASLLAPLAPKGPNVSPGTETTLEASCVKHLTFGTIVPKVNIFDKNLSIYAIWPAKRVRLP